MVKNAAVAFMMDISSRKTLNYTFSYMFKKFPGYSRTFKKIGPSGFQDIPGHFKKLALPVLWGRFKLQESSRSHKPGSFRPITEKPH